MRKLAECGIPRLSGEVSTLEINGNRITVCGVDDPYAWADVDGFKERTEGSFRAQIQQVAARMDKETYTILLTHRPELIDVYSQYDFDLVLSGHAHGGQVQLFGRGLYAPGQGLFPKLTNGFYEDGRLFVSRGMTNSAGVPRFHNPTELVILNLIY